MSEHQKQTVEGLVIDLIRIRAAAKGLEGILASALSNASGNIEHDDVSRRVRGFREALECLPEGEPIDSMILDRLQSAVIDRKITITESDGEFSAFSTIGGVSASNLRDTLSKFISYLQ